MALGFVKTNIFIVLLESFELAKKYIEYIINDSDGKIISINSNDTSYEVIYEIITVIDRKEVKEVIEAIAKKVFHQFTSDEINNAFYSRDRGIYLIYNSFYEFFELFLDKNNANKFIDKKINELNGRNKYLWNPYYFFKNKFFKIYEFSRFIENCEKKDKIIRVKFITD